MIQKTLLLILILTLSSFAHSQDWYAMARHGECYDLAEFSKNSSLIIGAPTGHNVHITEVRLANGAGFIVAIAGNMMTMPGLPKVPAAERIDIDDDGNISGLF